MLIPHMISTKICLFLLCLVLYLFHHNTLYLLLLKCQHGNMMIDKERSNFGIMSNKSWSWSQRKLLIYFQTFYFLSWCIVNEESVGRCKRYHGNLHPENILPIKVPLLNSLSENFQPNYSHLEYSHQCF